MSPLVPASFAPPERPQVPAPPEYPPESLWAFKELIFPNNFFGGGHVSMALVAGPRAKATEGSAVDSQN